MVSSSGLTPFSETKYEHRAPPGLPLSCPTLDLSVTWDAAGGNVLIYRPKDQVVSKIHQGGRGRGAGDAKVTAVRWKPDGQFIAVGWDDGHVRLMGLENNKAAHTIKVADGSSPVRISYIGWARNRVGKKAGKKINGVTSETWRGVLERDGKVGDLPRELTFLEVDTALPKISPLPSGSVGSGEDAMVFTLRTGIDYLFQPFKPEDSEEVSVMMVGTNNGDIHLSIYDSFTVGSFLYEPNSRLQLTHHASHPDVSTHSLLFKHEGQTKVLDLVPVDISFLVSSPINLSLLASKLTTLQKLLRYLRQASLHMQVEYKNTRDLPRRFLGVVQESLQETDAPAGPKDIVASLYHTVVTGHTYEPVKEWLVDNLTERGHKRWDKAVTSGLENLRSLVHENFLPALDRTAIILSRLKGLAQFHSSRSDTGLSATQITRLADVVASLTLVGHRTLLIVMEELELFRSFSAWLRLQIDKLASSSASDEMTEREVVMNHAAVLTYLRHYLVKSPLDSYLGEDGNTDRDVRVWPWEEVAKGGSLMEAVKGEVGKEQEGKVLTGFVCGVGNLLGLLDSKAAALFADIAEAQKRSVRCGDRTRIVLSGEVARVDTRMGAVYRDNGAVDGVVYTAATANPHEKEIFLYRTAIPILNGISSTPTSQCTAISLPHKVIDVKFLSPTVLLALLAPKDLGPMLARIPVAHEELSWSEYIEGAQPEISKFNARTIEVPAEDGFVPVEMEVHPSADVRGPVPGRVCLLGSDRSTYCVFALDGA